MVDRPPRHVLVVEDNPIDARALLRAAKSLPVSPSVEVVIDGDQALAYLRDSDRPVPDLVLLDLNLPGRDGHDVLAAMKGDDVLKRVPVVVLSTSATDTDVLGAYDAGANAYVSKPTSLDGWQVLVAGLDAFWFSFVRLPPS